MCHRPLLFLLHYIALSISAWIVFKFIQKNIRKTKLEGFVKWKL